MKNYITKQDLSIHAELIGLLDNEILPGLDVSEEQVWVGFSKLVHELAPLNRALLEKRQQLQEQIDQWHRDHPQGLSQDFSAYKQFLMDIGYLVAEGETFAADTKNVDDEIATIAGPQLVVPVNNARFALNAANARWGSLYDAYYGTDVIDEREGRDKSGAYNSVRGKAVIQKATEFLDQSVPLAKGQHAAATAYEIESGELQASLDDGSKVGLAKPEQFIGSNQVDDTLVLLLQKNKLHIELHIDHQHPIGKDSAAGVKDIVIESAISTIMDCEDSVAAVDGQDKALVYRNWLGLMKGDLEETFKKGDQTIIRKMNPNRHYAGKDGQAIELHGRSLLLVRNVGHLMTNNAILDAQGNEVPEGFLDALFTTLGAMHDFKEDATLHNSRTKSIYIVKPKMHGPEEAAFTNTLFSGIEDILGLPRNTMKIGVMDE